MPAETTIPCFTCGTLQIVNDPTKDQHGTQVDRTRTLGCTNSASLIFRATGNYGSTIFDPLGREALQIVICDACVMERIERVEHIVRPGQVPDGGWMNGWSVDRAVPAATWNPDKVQRDMDLLAQMGR